MNELTKMLSNSEKFKSFLDEVKHEKSPVSLTGLTDVMKCYFAHATNESLGKRICVVTYNEIQARNMVKNLEFFTEQVIFIPKKEIVTYDYIVDSKELPYERIEALNKLQQNKVDIVVTTIEALMQKMVAKEVLYQHKIKFQVGKTYSLEEIKNDLVHLGYVRYDLIEGRGQFSMRGGILDIALNEKKGVRIEFWGDEVDSIRYFNIASQRSTEMCKEITIYPAHEFVLEKPIHEVVETIQKEYEEKFEEAIKQDIEQIENGDYISKIDKYFHCFYENKGSLLDYLENDDILFLDEVSKIKARAKNIVEDNHNIQNMLIEKEKIIPEAILNLTEETKVFEQLEKQKTVYLEKQDMGVAKEERTRQNEIRFLAREINYYKSNMEVFLEDLVKAINEDKTVIVLGRNRRDKPKIIIVITRKRNTT